MSHSSRKSSAKQRALIAARESQIEFFSRPAIRERRCTKSIGSFVPRCALHRGRAGAAITQISSEGSLSRRAVVNLCRPALCLGGGVTKCVHTRGAASMVPAERVLFSPTLMYTDTHTHTDSCAVVLPIERERARGQVTGQR